MLGTKGLSCCLWLFFLNVAVVFFHPTVSPMVLLLAVLILKHWLRDVPQARKESKEKGLEAVVLLPVNSYFAHFLTRTSRSTIKAGKEKFPAYEIHVIIPDALQKAGVWTVIKTIQKDLFLMRKTTSGLFLWDTTMSIPKKTQQEIGKAIRNGAAFWENGGYKVPRFPGTQMELKSHKNKRTHGAIFFREGDNF